MSVTKSFVSYRILIVDDLDSQRSAIKTAISEVVPNCGFVEAASVTEAENILQKKLFFFDLVVIDIRLEEVGKDGITLLQALRYKPSRIIMVTAHPNNIKQICESYERGADSYINKLDGNYTSLLQRKVKELLEQSDVRENLRRQHESLSKAEEALAKNHEEWVKKYGGMFVLVYEGKVVESKDNPYKLQDAIDRYSDRWCETAVIKVPLS